MAQPPLAGADAIRGLTDDDAIFEAFDSYPWTKDSSFLSGLSAILGPNSSSAQGSPADMATHARIFYYTQRIGVNIDFAKYQSWLAAHPNHEPPQVLPAEFQDTEREEDVLPWQQAAPKAELYVDKSAQAADSAASGGAEQPNYPMGFAEMIKLLQEGKPIPGIKQIPNTIARDPSVKPVGTRSAPKKPWERDVTPSAPEVSLPNALDTEFPPVENDGSPSASAAEPVPS